MKRTYPGVLVVLCVAGAAEPRSVEAAAPVTIDWVTGDYIPDVGDQGCTESCVAWATRTVAAFHRLRLARGFSTTYPCPAAGTAAPAGTANSFAGGSKDSSLPPSATFIFNAALRRDFADAPNKAPNLTFAAWVGESEEDRRRRMSFNVQTLVDQVLLTFGAPSEKVAPFNADWSATPGANQILSAETLRSEWTGAIAGAAPVQFSGTTTQGRNVLRNALCDGPVIVLVHTFADFLPCGLGGDYAPPAISAGRPAQQPGPQHAMVVVEYDADHSVPGDGPGGAPKNKPAFRMLNSWGPDWGDRGYVWISADRLFGCYHGNGRPMVQELWRMVPGPRRLIASMDPALPAGFVVPGANGWIADGSTACSGPCLDPILTPTPPSPSPPDRNPPPLYEGTKPGPDGGPGVCSVASLPPRIVPVERVAGAQATVTAPRYPLVPALAGTTVRYFVDGRDAEDIDPASTGYAFHSAGHDTRKHVKEILQVTHAAPSPRSDGEKPRDRVPGGSDEDVEDVSPQPCPVPIVDSGVGQDMNVVGACIDRGILEIIDPKHPGLANGRDIPICIQVTFPGECEPRRVKRYVLRIAK